MLREGIEPGSLNHFWRTPFNLTPVPPFQGHRRPAAAEKWSKLFWGFGAASSELNLPAFKGVRVISQDLCNLK